MMRYGLWILTKQETEADNNPLNLEFFISYKTNSTTVYHSFKYLKYCQTLINIKIIIIIIIILMTVK